MTPRYVVHIVSHSHWDREWYMPFQKHRFLLVELMDSLVELFDRDPDFRSFHLDGQMIVLGDYLEIRPEMQSKIQRLVDEGKLIIGPWYVLQDEFLTSSEANLRNLWMGHHLARGYGSIAKIGYFPDSFGNVGQAPQILKQAGIDVAAFGRGVTPTGFNNTVGAGELYESPFSELRWRSPDGSDVLGILFANWYSNGNEIPVDPIAAKSYWDQKLADAARFASTRHLLFMNGCDHQPVQQNLSEAISLARELYPDVQFVHSTFPEYMAALQSAVPSDLSVIDGELRSQRTDGWGTLVNTASSRMYLKQWNHRVQTTLEKVAEPLSTMAAMSGGTYPFHSLNYAWKTLMKNHPHDSICGCSVDEVHREMLTRFEGSMQVAQMIVEEAADELSDHIDTSCFAVYDEAHPFVLFNTSGWNRSGTVTAVVELARAPVGVDETVLRDISIADYQLIDSAGRAISCSFEDLGNGFAYELPKDKFRVAFRSRKVKVTFRAEHVPALGYAAYALVRGGTAARVPGASMATGRHTMENEFVRVQIRENGSLTVEEKETGRTYTDLLLFEDTGDIGNEYMYMQPVGEPARTTRNETATITLVEDTDFRIAYDIEVPFRVPAAANDRLRREQQAMIPFWQRKAQRVEELVDCVLTSRVTLECGSRAISVTTTFVNRASDHRLRALFPTDVDVDWHEADSIFEVARRDNHPAKEWKNPSNCQHQQAFVSVRDLAGVHGLTIVNEGLPEYEILRDGRNTVALTLLRSVGELGDWGWFPTPEAQCLGAHAAKYSIILHSPSHARNAAINTAYQSRVPWTTRQTSVHEGTLPATYAFLTWTGDSIALSSVKRGEDAGDVIVRWFNTSNTPQTLRVQLDGNPAAYRSNVLEERVDRLSVQEGFVELTLRGSEIFTIALDYGADMSK